MKKIELIKYKLIILSIVCAYYFVTLCLSTASTEVIKGTHRARIIPPSDEELRRLDSVQGWGTIEDVYFVSIKNEERLDKFVMSDCTDGPDVFLFVDVMDYRSEANANNFIKLNWLFDVLVAPVDMYKEGEDIGKLANLSGWSAMSPLDDYYSLVISDKIMDNGAINIGQYDFSIFIDYFASLSIVPKAKAFRVWAFRVQVFLKDDKNRTRAYFERILPVIMSGNKKCPS